MEAGPGEQLMWGIKNGDMELVQLLINKGSERSALHRPALVLAADCGQLEIVKLLVKQGENVNEPDQHGIRPLLAAVWEGHTDCVEFLLSKVHPTIGEGARKDIDSPSGESLTDCAGSEEIKALLSKTEL